MSASIVYVIFQGYQGPTIIAYLLPSTFIEDLYRLFTLLSKDFEEIKARDGPVGVDFYMSTYIYIYMYLLI